MRKSQKTAVAELEVLPPAKLDVPANLAARLENAYLEAISGMQKVLTFGLLCIQAKNAVPHGQFKQWISEYCPRISYRTAAVFKKLTEALVESINDKSAQCALLDFDPEKLFSVPSHQLPESIAKVRSELEEVIEHKSQYQLELEFGIRKPRTGQLVGKGNTNNPEGKNGASKARDPFQNTEVAWQYIFGTRSHTVIEDDAVLGRLRFIKNKKLFTHLPFPAQHRMAELLRELATDVEQCFQRGLEDSKAAQTKADKKTRKAKK